MLNLYKILVNVLTVTGVIVVITRLLRGLSPALLAIMPQRLTSLMMLVFSQWESDFICISDHYSIRCLAFYFRSFWFLVNLYTFKFWKFWFGQKNKGKKKGKNCLYYSHHNRRTLSANSIHGRKSPRSPIVIYPDQRNYAATWRFNLSKMN